MTARPLPPANGDAVRNYRAEEHYAELFAQLRAKDALIGELVEALDSSRIAIDDWLHCYAPEFCGKAHVQETRDRLLKAGGTLAYIADIQHDNRAALTAVRAHTAASMCREAGASEVAVFSRSDGPPSDSPIEQEE